MDKSLRVAELLALHGESLQLTALTAEPTLESRITTSEVARPGLALCGFTERFAYHRTQIFGETEMAYLRSLTEERLAEVVENLLSFEVPCLVLCKGQQPPPRMAEIADRRGRPILGTTLGTQSFLLKLSTQLQQHFAPHCYVQGTLVDVYGVGLLYTGPSGIGKSECVLDLIERGHRLVCDDVVHVTRTIDNQLVGAMNQKLSHHMEIRGLGIIDVYRLFGIRAVRAKKRIEMVVELSHWSPGKEYDRTGLVDQVTRILEVDLPLIQLPLVPGKNITVVSEVIAMNYLLKQSGHHPAREFNRRLLEQMRRKRYIGNPSD